MKRIKISQWKICHHQYRDEESFKIIFLLLSITGQYRTIYFNIIHVIFSQY